MKIRNGFVSNSSSSSFICNPGNSEGSKDYTVAEAEEILTQLLNFYNELFDKNLLFDEVFGEIKLGDDDDVTFLQSWDTTWDKNRIEGKLIINSVGDNSIPYELFSLIESKFDAFREHLG